MVTFSILLQSVNDIKSFVNAAAALPCDVDVRCGKYLVDGKSIMGIFSVDLSTPVQVEVHGTNQEGEALRSAVISLVRE